MQRLTFSLVILSLSVILLGKVAMAEVLSVEGQPPLLAVAPQYDTMNKIRAAIISIELERAMGTVYGNATIIDQIRIPDTSIGKDIISVKSGSCEFEVDIEPTQTGTMGATHYRAKKATPVVTESCTKRPEADISTEAPEPYWKEVGIWQYLIFGFYSDIYNKFPYGWDKPKSISAIRGSDDTTFTISSTLCTLDVIIPNDLTYLGNSVPPATCQPAHILPRTHRSPAE